MNSSMKKKAHRHIGRRATQVCRPHGVGSERCVGGADRSHDGLAPALQHNWLIAIAGAVVGIAASLSMEASKYLSTKTEENSAKNSASIRRLSIDQWLMVMLPVS
jgi:hypothetical protein